MGTTSNEKPWDLDTFHISSIQMGHNMGCGPEENKQTKKIIMGMKVLSINFL